MQATVFPHVSIDALRSARKVGSSPAPAYRRKAASPPFRDVLIGPSAGIDPNERATPHVFKRDPELDRVVRHDLPGKAAEILPALRQARLGSDDFTATADQP